MATGSLPVELILQVLKLIDNRAGAGILKDGPYIHNDEYQSGFWIINAADHEEALALATEGSLACNRKVEVRALL